MMQGRQTGDVGGVQGAPVLEQQAHHGHGADGGGAVEGRLAARVLDAGGGAVGDERARGVEVVFRGGEVEGCLDGAGGQQPVLGSRGGMF